MSNEELKEKVINDFIKEYSRDKRVEKIMVKIKEKEASSEESHFFSLYLGEIAVGVLEKHLIINEKPIENFDRQMGEQVIIPLMELVHKKINDVCQKIQIIEDEKNGIGLEPYLPTFPKEKINGMIEELVKYAQEDLTNV